MWNKKDKNQMGLPPTTFNDYKSGEGFTLIELMAVVFILATGLVGINGLILQISSFSHQALAKLEASYLAQEGVEIVRNIRDSNWLESVSWDTGLANGDHEADLDDQTLSSYQNRFLLVGNGFYNYDVGEQTRFKRKINIQKSGDQILVSVTISWIQSERDYTVTAAERLYNWRR